MRAVVPSSSSSSSPSGSLVHVSSDMMRVGVERRAGWAVHDLFDWTRRRACFVGISFSLAGRSIGACLGSISQPRMSLGQLERNVEAMEWIIVSGVMKGYGKRDDYKSIVLDYVKER